MKGSIRLSWEPGHNISGCCWLENDCSAQDTSSLTGFKRMLTVWTMWEPTDNPISWERLSNLIYKTGFTKVCFHFRFWAKNGGGGFTIRSVETSLSNLIYKTYFHRILKAEDERHRRHPLEISNMEILHINLISQRREPSIGKLQLKMELFADMCLMLTCWHVSQAFRWTFEIN